MSIINSDTDVEEFSSTSEISMAHSSTQKSRRKLRAKTIRHNNDGLLLKNFANTPDGKLIKNFVASNDDHDVTFVKKIVANKPGLQKSSMASNVDPDVTSEKSGSPNYSGTRKLELYAASEDGHAATSVKKIFDNKIMTASDDEYITIGRANLANHHGTNHLATGVDKKSTLINKNIFGSKSERPSLLLNDDQVVTFKNKNSAALSDDNIITLTKYNSGKNYCGKSAWGNVTKDDANIGTSKVEFLHADITSNLSVKEANALARKSLIKNDDNIVTFTNKHLQNYSGSISDSKSTRESFIKDVANIGTSEIKFSYDDIGKNLTAKDANKLAALLALKSPHKLEIKDDNIVTLIKNNFGNTSGKISS